MERSEQLSSGGSVTRLALGEPACCQTFPFLSFYITGRCAEQWYEAARNMQGAADGDPVGGWSRVQRVAEQNDIHQPLRDPPADPPDGKRAPGRSSSGSGLMSGRPELRRGGER